jgi:hypothetical protein
MRDKFIFEMIEGSTSVAVRNRQADIEIIFAANKASRKLLSDIAYTEQKADLAKTANLTVGQEEAVHNALNRYEKAHLDIGSWPRIRASLKLRWKNMLIAENNRIATLSEPIGGQNAVLGKVYLDHMRFQPLAIQPTDLPLGVQVYQRIGDKTGRHYVLLPARNETEAQQFVRRFVIRGLNGHNSIELTGSKPMTAAHKPKPASIAKPQPNETLVNDAKRHSIAQVKGARLLTEKEQIISHARGWTKRYISAGVGGKVPLSTRGTAFDSLFGNVVIDLAKVDRDKIFDLHAPDVAEMNLGIDPKTVVTQGSQYPAQDFEGEVYLAMRDVLRTRELLIKGSVPRNAIIASPQGKVILGVGFPSKMDRATYIQHLEALPEPQMAKEDEKFVWSDGKRWIFLKYATQQQCDLAETQVLSDKRGLSGKDVMLQKINLYSFSRPDGMPA